MLALVIILSISFLISLFITSILFFLILSRDARFVKQQHSVSKKLFKKYLKVIKEKISQVAVKEISSTPPKKDTPPKKALTPEEKRRDKLLTELVSNHVDMLQDPSWPLYLVAEFVNADKVGYGWNSTCSEGAIYTFQVIGFNARELEKVEWVKVRFVPSEYVSRSDEMDVRLSEMVRVIGIRTLW